MRIRGTLRLQNEVLLSAIEKKSGSMKKFSGEYCSKFGLKWSSLYVKIIKLVDLDFKGWKDDYILILCTILELDPDIVAPPEIRGETIQSKATSVTDVPVETLQIAGRSFNDRMITESPLESLVVRDQVDRLMVNLKPVEREVLIRHTVKSETFRQIGDSMGVSASRVQQIETNAINKARKYSDYIDAKEARRTTPRRWNTLRTCSSRA